MLLYVGLLLFVVVGVAVMSLYRSVVRNQTRGTLSAGDIKRFQWSEVIQDDAVALELAEWIRREGFAVVDAGPEERKFIREYWECANEFMSLPQEVKDSYKGRPKYTDNIDKRPVNKGYLRTACKEYLKLRFGDERAPVPDMVEEKLRPCIAGYSALARRAFEMLCATYESTHPESRQLRNTLESFIEEGSSISYINYHPIEQGDAKASTTGEEGTDTHFFPSSTHYDTGLCTVITCSTVPALEIQDRVTKEWIMPEKFCDPCRSVFVIAGRKFSLLGHEDDEVQPTLHRVRLPYGVQRNTMLYFQDLPA